MTANDFPRFRYEGPEAAIVPIKLNNSREQV